MLNLGDDLPGTSPCLCRILQRGKLTNGLLFLLVKIGHLRLFIRNGFKQPGILAKPMIYSPPHSVRTSSASYGGRNRYRRER
jgi:hypothetical protein